jgi:Transposase DDE domain group 1
MTKCNQETFAFKAHLSRRVGTAFSAGQMSTDGGGLRLREVGRKINLLGRLSLVRRQLAEMLAQHINGLALGYEDLNDPEQLRSDPLLGVLSGKRDLDEPLAGKGTLNRVAMPVKGYNV